MAKLMVMIDVPGMLHDELLKELKDKDSSWWSKGSSGLVVIHEARLRKSTVAKSSYIFELIGVRP